jgi:phosphoheptose isomerase
VSGRFDHPLPAGRRHLDELLTPLADLQAHASRIDGWGARIAERLVDGARLLAVGNGGSAAEAQHLTAELVGRYRDERMPLSAIALCSETSSLTAIGNDYGIEELYARQVRAHGRPGDVFVGLSTSGRSPNVLAAAAAAGEMGLWTIGLTGAAPNPLAEACDDALAVDSPHTATVQEIHLICVHLMCAGVDTRLAALGLQAEAVS